MNLSEIIDNSRSDKNTVHSYLGLYQNLLVNKKYSAKNILEIGIHQGGSIKLWYDFFPNAMIYGLDIIPIKNVWDEIKNKDRIRLGRFNAYDKNLIINQFLNKNIKFDFILYDGPNTLESMKQFIQLYTQLITDDGILIIEDVQDWTWIEILKNEVPENLKEFINVYDLRENKNRYDDIVFTIDKMNIKEPVLVVEEPVVVVEEPVVVVEEPVVVVEEPVVTVEEPVLVVEEPVVVAEEPVVVVEEPVVTVEEPVVVVEEPVVVVEEPVVVVEEPVVVVEEPAVIVEEPIVVLEEPVVVVEEPVVVVEEPVLVVEEPLVVVEEPVVVVEEPAVIVEEPVVVVEEPVVVVEEPIV